MDSSEADVTKFYGQGMKAGGTKVRNGMQAIKTLAQKFLTEVQEIKNKDK